VVSADLQRIVASEVALGRATGELAERHGYTKRGMRKLISSPGLQVLIAEERESLAERAEQYRLELLGLGETAIENVRRAIEDPQHPRNVETSRWLLDKVCYPPRHSVVEVNVEPQPSEAVLRQLAEALDRARVARTPPPGSRIPLLEDHLIEPGPHASTR
jgi:hypothetical protein